MLNLFQYLTISIDFIEILKQVHDDHNVTTFISSRLYLDELHKAMQKLDIKYLRYADDWIILAETKHKYL